MNEHSVCHRTARTGTKCALIRFAYNGRRTDNLRHVPGRCMMSTIKEKVENAGEAVGDAAKKAGEKIKEGTETAAEKAAKAAKSTGQAAKDAGDKLKERAAHNRRR
jgi:hypothetical protein